MILTHSLPYYPQVGKEDKEEDEEDDDDDDNDDDDDDDDDDEDDDEDDDDSEDDDDDDEGEEGNDGEEGEVNPKPRKDARIKVVPNKVLRDMEKAEAASAKARKAAAKSMVRYLMILNDIE